ncbi:b(0,+)-type amino acid transporter 1 isoform X2 [Orussus abietinus]|nr:b(0,+)-type amino acid transporter 1 isoform X2 [Orussus abietinus]XP_012287427.1 b(0,+)-type amino acid transporter 1 isoform X2 [Orussus abietinus]XP_012287428.1 b(0,+)-type amino acid transporter 1 isoform X2 [Orussus abietinus]XP_012287429.1 b(0,+)-type amino acid transporter 1 isoform X2 [Orussus abietinus]XP_012287431.1 b(0,+)-type amino acid transporter 1 isoform X2 [Orussus abietinus]XP_023289733.1 b(0,+)-type amino acid transporter 1 isoform X2 [Orussus abietinus]
MAFSEVKENGPKVALKRELGLFSAVSLILAVMIGSGIFVSPTSALERSGSVGFCLIIWASCGALSLLGALAFAELGTVVPRSGAEYVFFVEAFAPLHHYLGQLPAFICSWVYVMVLRPAEVAVVILTFAEYSVQPFTIFMADIPKASMVQVKKLIALLALGLITYINISSVKLFVRVQNVFTVCKVAACVMVISGGLWWLASGRTELLKDPFEGTIASPGSIALAFYSGLWAYDGWTSATIVTEEVQRPEVNILRSILIAVPTISILYVSMNLMYMSALTIPEMIGAPAVAVLWAERVLPGWMGFVIPLGVALSTFGCALSIQFGVSRLCYVAGQEGHVPRIFSFVHVTRMTPAAAVAFQGMLSLACIMLGNIVELIEFASFLTWVFYGLAMIALLVMRRTKADVHRPYSVPTLIPWLVLLVAIFLAVLPIVEDPSPKYLFAVAFILLGIGVYHCYVFKKRKSFFMRKLTFLAQVLCMVVPSDQCDD